jgi:hypothetical protein
MARVHSNKPGYISNMMRQSSCDATYLDEILALRLGHEWLQLRGGKGVNEARL